MPARTIADTRLRTPAVLNRPSISGRSLRVRSGRSFRSLRSGLELLPGVVPQVVDRRRELELHVASQEVLLAHDGRRHPRWDEVDRSGPSRELRVEALGLGERVRIRIVLRRLVPDPGEVVHRVLEV